MITSDKHEALLAALATWRPCWAALDHDEPEEDDAQAEAIAHEAMQAIDAVARAYDSYVLSSSAPNLPCLRHATWQGAYDSYVLSSSAQLTRVQAELEGANRWAQTMQIEAVAGAVFRGAVRGVLEDMNRWAQVRASGEPVPLAHDVQGWAATLRAALQENGGK